MSSDDQDLTSSPDPIALSPPPSTGRTPTRSPRKFVATPRSSNGHGKHTVDFTINTPPARHQTVASSPTRAGPSTEDVTSPWRIRVTVEAEPDEENGRSISDSPRRPKGLAGVTRTLTLGSRTTTVPLKGLNSSPPQPNRPGHVRRSDVTPRKKSVSPAHGRERRRKTFGDAVDGENSEDEDFDLTPRRRARKGTRKSVARGNTVTATVREGAASEEAPADSVDNPTSAATKRRGRRKAMSPVKIAVDPDADSQDHPDPQHSDNATNSSSDSALGIVEPNRAASSSKGVTLMQLLDRDEAPNAQEDYYSEQWTGAETKFGPAKKTSRKARQSTMASTRIVNEQTNDAGRTVHYPTPDKSPENPSTARNDDTNAEEQLQEDENEEADGLGDLREFDSVLDSEGFSMVSIASIPGVKGHINTSSINEPLRHSTASSTRSKKATPPILPSTIAASRSTSQHSSLQQEHPQPNIAPVQHTHGDQQPDSSYDSDSFGPDPNLSRSNHLPEAFVTKSTGQATRLVTPDDSWEATPSQTQEDIAIQSAMNQRYLGKQPLVQPITLNRPQKPTPVESIASSPPARVLAYSTELQASVHQTPSMPFSSPSLPPPLPVANVRSETRTESSENIRDPGEKEKTPKLACVVKAGIALQGVLGTKKQLGSPFTSPAKARKLSPSQNQSALESLFNDFGQGTRRELRAGLKFGEELARRQREAEESQEAEVHRVSTTEDDVFAQEKQEGLAYPQLPSPTGKEGYRLSLPGSKPTQQAQLPEVRAPEPSSLAKGATESRDGDEMSWKTDTPVKVFQPTIGKSSVTPAQRQDEDGDDQHVGNVTSYSTMTEREARWQRERKTVSHQIDQASASKVIVIDDTSSSDMSSGSLEQTDDESDEPQPIHSSDGASHASPQRSVINDEDEVDVWKAEAHSSSIESAGQDRRNSPGSLFMTSSVLKPAREKVHSPRRREGEVVYSDEAQEDECAALECTTFSDIAARRKAEKARDYDGSASNEKSAQKDELAREAAPRSGEAKREADQGRFSLTGLLSLTGSVWSSRKSVIGKSQLSQSQVISPDQSSIREASLGKEAEHPQAQIVPDHITVQESPVTSRLESESIQRSAVEIRSHGEPTTEHASVIDPPVITPTPIASVRASPKPPTSKDNTSSSAALQAKSDSHAASSVVQMEPLTPASATASNANAPYETPVSSTPSNIAPSESLRAIDDVWEKPHWKALDDLYATTSASMRSPLLPYPIAFDVSTFPSASKPHSARCADSLFNQVIKGDGRCLILGPTEVLVVEAFMDMLRDDNDGRDLWPERVIAKRLFAVLLGEERREEKRAREREAREEAARLIAMGMR